MAQITPAERQLEVAHILRRHIADYQREYPLWPEHRKIVSDLLNCRIAKLEGRLERCDACGVYRIIYHSCRNRHCPKCRHMPRERWPAKRKDEILPTSYYHVVFTLPHELNVAGYYTHWKRNPVRSRSAASFICALSIIPPQ